MAARETRETGTLRYKPAVPPSRIFRVGDTVDVLDRDHDVIGATQVVSVTTRAVYTSCGRAWEFDGRWRSVGGAWPFPSIRLQGEAEMASDIKAPQGLRKAWNGGVRPVIGLDLIAEEQARQVSKYPPAHDDAHTAGELAVAAAALAIDDADCVPEISGTDFVGDLVTLDDVDWITPLVKKHRDDRIRQLAIAGAFIASEIDRLLRARKRDGEA